jgi:hypothetical protein
MALARLCAHQNLPENQCVFVRGFRVARPFWPLPKHLKAAASPPPDPEGSDSDPDTGLVSIPAITKVKDSVRSFSVLSDVLKYRDPLHILLDYIAEASTTPPQYSRSQHELCSKHLIAIWCSLMTMTWFTELAMAL